MKKSIAFLFLSFFLFSPFTFAQRNTFQFAERWAKVDKLSAEQLPESALKEVELIFAEAQRTHNFAETVKSFIYKMRFILEKNQNEAPALLKDFEEFARISKNPEEKALFHSMLAELYTMYYVAQRTTINQRTQLEGYTPENINEWSKNIFFDKISEEIKLSLQDAASLQTTTLSNLTSLINAGTNDAEYQPTLFDFLAQRGITILQSLNNITSETNPLNDPLYFGSASDFIQLETKRFTKSKENINIEIYRQLLDFHLKQNNIQALLYVDLQRLEYVRGTTENFDAENLYEKALLTLSRQYFEYGAVVEVLERLARFYLSRQDAHSNKEINYKKQAFEIVESGINKHSDYKRIETLKNIKKTILQKTITIDYPAVVAPNNEFTLNVTATNVEKFELKLYRIDATAQEYYTFKQNNNRATYPKRTAIDTKKFTLIPSENFSSISTEVSLMADEYGIYEFAIAQKDDYSEMDQVQGVFTVTDFSFIQRSAEKNQANAYILNRLSGKPIANAEVEIVYYEWNGKEQTIKNVGKTKSKEDGQFHISSDRSTNVLFFSKAADRYFSSQSYNYFFAHSAPVAETALTFFTDRSIYRPGQTVHFKGIAYSTYAQQVIKDTTFEIKILDANWQEISTKTIKTNALGSFSGEFILPANGLNGAYRLQNDLGSVEFYVEEYKRPTFEVKIKEPDEQLSFGQSVIFDGNVKTYTGHSISNAQIRYNIRRNPHPFFRRVSEPSSIVANGALETDTDGNFQISFIPEKTQNKSIFTLLHDSFYTYTLTASVTDSKGETQQATQTISVGDKSLFILTETSEIYNKQNPVSIPIQTKTINGKNTSSLITYTLFLLNEEGVLRENISDFATLKQQQKIFSGIFDTKSKSLDLNLSKQKSGYYKLLLTTSDSQGREVKQTLTFILHSPMDKRVPIKTYQWLTAESTEFQHGQTAEIRFGSSEQIIVLYEIMHGSTSLSRQWIELNDEIRTFRIPFEKSFADGVEVIFTFVKDQRLHTSRKQLKLNVKKKQLSPKLTVFRDKLKPGQVEEWTVTIPQVTSNQTLAELLTVMYDASLDAIRPHNWAFDPTYKLHIPAVPAWSGGGVGSNRNTSINERINFYPLNTLIISRLNWFGLNFYNYNINPIFRAGGPRISATAEIHMESSSDLAKSQSSNEESTPIRSNFSETSFFYPQLQTDSNGNVKFSFTVPESLTRWNIKMLAHTADLQFGQNEQQAITQKELMIQLNMPRFVRRSDSLHLVANVTNFTEKPLVAEVKLELIDPQSGQIITITDNNIRTLNLNANTTQAVEWTITEFSHHDLLAVKATAKSGTFADGEQHNLPVLPDKMLVTEALPLIIREGETRNFQFESLKKNLQKVETKSLTVEFSTNPIYYAIQTLQAIAEPQNENAIDYFTAYYVNNLTTYILNSNSEIKEIFERWKHETTSHDPLSANLQKNTELKNILLAETPWVMEAKSEEAQREQLTLLFEQNEQDSKSRENLAKLIELQRPSGAFAWFKGMSDDRQLTQQILLGMSRLKTITNSLPLLALAQIENVRPEESETWILRAIEYLDMQIAQDFNILKQNNKNYRTSQAIAEIHCQYLHLRSAYSHIPVAPEAIEAVKFYTSQAKKYWTAKTLYGKAAIAIAAFRNGDTALANKILKSLKENALKSTEMGTYWANNTGGIHWNERPVAIQTAIIEAFTEIAEGDDQIDEMKIWLLKQKQTQHWDSPLSAVDAVYSLLNGVSNYVETSEIVEIKLNNQTINPPTAEAGTGYFKKIIPADEITPEMANITLKHAGSRIGWGAIYWQYQQSIDKIEQSGSPLSIEKKLFVERIIDNRTIILPVEQSTIRKGDKIITRLIISADRDLQFVALNDLRSAAIETLDQSSRIIRSGGITYYQTNKDSSTHLFFSNLPKGTHIFEYASWANNAGQYIGTTASIQCLYAPEFVSHSRSAQSLLIQGD